MESLPSDIHIFVYPTQVTMTWHHHFNSGQISFELSDGVELMLLGVLKMLRDIVPNTSQHRKVLTTAFKELHRLIGESRIAGAGGVDKPAEPV